jgi:hypothetical protein
MSPRSVGDLGLSRPLGDLMATRTKLGSFCSIPGPPKPTVEVAP